MSRLMSPGSSLRTTLLVALFLLTSAAQATTVLRVTFSEAVDRAELIAVGTVSAVEETWDARSELPFTLVTVSDVDVLKDDAGRSDRDNLTLSFLGGSSPDGSVLEIVGMPRFRLNEQVVVFSAGNGVVMCPLVGWWQGLYRVIRDAERNVLTVTDHAGRRVTAIDGDVGQRVTRISSANRAAQDAASALTLDEFRSLVRQEL